MTALVTPFQGGEVDEAAFRDLPAPLHDVLFSETNPVPLKAALAILKLGSDHVRLPLLPANQSTRERLRGVMARVMSLEEPVAAQTYHALAN